MRRKKHRATVTFCTAEALEKAMAADPPCIEGVHLRVSLPGVLGRRYGSDHWFTCLVDLSD